MSKLGSLLVRERLLSESDRKFIQRERGNYRGSFARSVLAMGLLDEDELAALFAAKTAFKIAAKKLTNHIQGDAVGCVPGPLLQWFDVIPIKKQSGTLHVAMVDPTDREVISQLEFFSGMPIRPVIAPMSDIHEAIERHMVGKIEFHRSEFEDFLTNHSDHASRFARRQKGAFGVIDITDEPISWGSESETSDSYDGGSSGAEMFELLTDDSEPETLESSPSEDFSETVPVAASELVPSAADDFSDAGLGAETEADDDLVDDATAQQSMVADVFPDDGQDLESSTESSAEKSGASAGGLDDLSLEDESLDLDADLDLDFEGDGGGSSKKVEAAPVPVADLASDVPSIASDEAGSSENLSDELVAASAAEALETEDSGLDMGLDAPLESEKPSELSSDSFDLSPTLDTEPSLDPQPSLDPLLSADSPEIAADLDAEEAPHVDEGSSLDLAGESVLGEELDEVNALSGEKEIETAPRDADADFDLGGLAEELGKNEVSFEQESTLELAAESNLEAEVPDSEAAAPADVMHASFSEAESSNLNDDLSSVGSEGGENLSLENDISPSLSDVNLSTSSFDIPVEQEPALDVDVLGETFGSDGPSLDGLSTAALSGQVSPVATPSVASMAHEGVATLNRALVNLALLMDGKKALNRLADAADKVGIVSGVILKVTGNSIKPGILWNREASQLGSIYDVPAGLSAETLTQVLAEMHDDKLEHWLEVVTVLGKSADRFKAAWPAADNIPTHFYARKQGDAFTVAIVRFTELADHGGIRDAFGELVRAVAGKI